MIALHDIERRLILALAGSEGRLDGLSRVTGLSMDQVRRGVEWLRYKGIVSIEERAVKQIGIGREGLNALKGNLPEVRLVDAVAKHGAEEGEGVSLRDARMMVDLTDDEFNAAIRYAREKGLITISNGRLYVKGSVDLKSLPEYRLLARLEGGWLRLDELGGEELNAYRMLRRRPDYIVERDVKDITVRLSDHGHSVLKQILDEQVRVGGEGTPAVKRIDVAAPAPIIYAGRRHILQDVIDEVREILIGMGFEEIDGRMVQSSFWNFDALFTPQDHPAREMQDTFYIAGINASSIDADAQTVDRVSSIHAREWGYTWSSEEARRLVLRTHTTAVTIRYLADHRPDEANVFSVGRVFRNEKLSYKHLAEFHQVEGIVVSRDATLRDLMGIQQEFYRRLGLNRVRFWPTYFPYTEPSLQSMVYHERLGRWVELFGMGIFRPEVTEPLGIDRPVLAWGGGLERIAMLKYGIDDVRELYSNRLSMLRGAARCQL